MNFNKKFKAFTLSELLVVLVIIGILVLIALPSLMPVVKVQKGRSAFKYKILPLQSSVE